MPQQNGSVKIMFVKHCHRYALCWNFLLFKKDYKPHWTLSHYWKIILQQKAEVTSEGQNDESEEAQNVWWSLEPPKWWIISLMAWSYTIRVLGHDKTTVMVEDF